MFGGISWAWGYTEILFPRLERTPEVAEGEGWQSRAETQIEKPNSGDPKREGQWVTRTTGAANRHCSQNTQPGRP